MESASIVHAVERIEAALARIEAASQQTASLQARHERLKESVARSLQDIDRLIGRRPE